MKRVMALMALTILTACDRAERADIRAEHDDPLYKAAMEDYRSGRLDAAIKGFDKLVAKAPANASARFQLACLLQDARRDFTGAYCDYREYVRQMPGSDKASLAKDRMALCEREVAKELATRYGFNGGEAALAELEKLRAELKAAQARVASSEKNLRESLRRIRTLSDEKDRLLDVVKGVGSGGGDAIAARPSVKEARELLEEDEESGASPVPAGEVAALAREAKEEEASSSPLLPKRVETKPVEKKDNPAPAEPKKDLVPERPKSYVVEAGDTLYGIAKRFYGTKEAWRKIQNANKATLSTDLRLKAGDTLVLP